MVGGEGRGVEVYQNEVGQTAFGHTSHVESQHFGTVHRGNGEGFGGGHHGRLFGTAFLYETGHLHRLAHVEVVRRGAAVGAEGYVDSGFHQFGIAEIESRAELEVGVGVVGDSGASVGKDFYVVVGEIYAVCEGGFLIQSVPFVEVLHGGEAEIAEGVVHLALSLGYMCVHQ